MALESGDETFLPRPPIPFSQLFLSQDKVLCRYWAEKAETVEQFGIPEIFVPVVLKLLHDTPIAGHLGRDRTLTAARRVCYWPKMCGDINNYVARCVTCADHKGTATGPAPMFQYPTPEQPWDLVSVDLLQLPKSRHGSQYLLVCIDHFSRFVVLAPVNNKTVASVAYALVTQLFCRYSTPRVLLTRVTK